MALSQHVFGRTNRGVPFSKLGWYERWESTSFFNVTTTTSLKLGVYGVEGHSQFGPCGTMSRVLLNALWRLKIPARKLQLLGDPARGYVNHTMVEYWSKGRWEVISPSDSSFVWRNARGQVATLAEIEADPAIRDQIRVWRNHWPATFANARHIRWEKLPAPVRGAIRLAMGPKRYESAETPRLYDQPRRLMFTLSSTAAALCLLLGLATRVLPGSGPKG
jgi:hypothetical protein